MTTELPKCSDDLFQNGASLLVATADLEHGAEDIEAWVIEIRTLSGQQVDWHYVGGRAVVRYLGERAEIKAAIDAIPVPDCIIVLWWCP